MIDLLENENCTGCHACASVCPESCITMESDKEGFWYPNIDKTKCVNCKLCEKACPVLSVHPVADGDTPAAYAAYNKDEKTRLDSSSGGVFSLLAEKIISDGGVVFGAAYNEKFDVEHIAVDTLDDIYKLRGSKYVQSKIGESYKQAKRFLEAGRKVLFTGTPCQIAGLKSILGKDFDNLYTQDLICHGVPSPLVWQKYVKFREKRSASSTRRAFFRHKKYGWKTFSVLFEFSNNTEYMKSHGVDSYMTGFLRNWSLRSSCYNCHFKGLRRQADITLADFWGIENVCPELDDDKGTSLIVIHSEKGRKLLDSVSSHIVYKDVDLNTAKNWNPSIAVSVEKPRERAFFIRKLKNKDFEKYVTEVLRKNDLRYRGNLCKRLVRKAKNFLRRVLKSI